MGDKTDIKVRLIAVSAFVIALILLINGPVKAVTCDEIMDKVRENNDVDSSESIVKMTLIDSSGGKRVRQFSMRIKNEADETKTLIYFEAPPDIKGTAYLVIQHTGKPDKSYIYFPSMGKIKKVSSSQNSQRFMGSDYTYGDFKLGKKGEHACKLLGEKKLETGEDTWNIENIPKSGSDKQYKKVVLWVDKAKYVILKADFHNLNGQKTKTMSVQEIKRKNNRWTTTRSTMEDHVDRHTTILELLTIKFGVDLPDSLFTPRNLEKE